MATDNPLCVFCEATNNLIDFLHAGETSAEAVGRLSDEYGELLVVIPTDQAMKRHEQAAKTPPEEITEERFNDMLNVLPPVDWTITGNGESFKMSERYTGSITSIFVKLNQRCFTFRDTIKLPHDDCCARVFHSEVYRAPKAAEAARAADTPSRD